MRTLRRMCCANKPLSAAFCNLHWLLLDNCKSLRGIIKNDDVNRVPSYLTDERMPIASQLLLLLNHLTPIEIPSESTPLAPLWHPFGTLLAPLWHPFGTPLAPFLAPLWHPPFLASGHAFSVFVMSIHMHSVACVMDSLESFVDAKDASSRAQATATEIRRLWPSLQVADRILSGSI